MALDSSNVRVAVTGSVYFAPTATAAPTDAETALPVAWLEVGLISEDGVTEARERSTSNIVAWQNADVVRTVTTESSITVAFTMIETNANSLELFYGSAVSAEGEISIVPAESGGRRSLVIDYVDGAELVRLYLPEAEVTEVGETVLVSGDAVGYPVTVTGYPATGGFSGKKWVSALDTTP